MVGGGWGSGAGRLPFTTPMGGSAGPRKGITTANAADLVADLGV